VGMFQAAILPFLARNIELKTKFTHFEVTVGNYLRVYKTLAGTAYTFQEAYFKELFHYNIVERKGQNPKAKVQQLAAVLASSSRLRELPQIKAPTLVLHGTADKLVVPAHARTYAPYIPDHKLVWLEGVGHEIPRDIIPEVHQEMFELFGKVKG